MINERWAASLAALGILLAAACSKSSPSSPSCAQASNTCTSSDGALRACAPPTGIYGAYGVSCAAGPCPPETDFCGSGELDVTDSSGALTKIAIPASGAYSAALAAGTYSVCANAPYSSSPCVRFVLAAGTLLRIDVATEASPGGDYTSLQVEAPQGSACDVTEGAYACAQGLVCLPESSSPLGGTCEAPLVSPIGGPCDSFDSTDPTHVCEAGLGCTLVGDGGLCTAQSAEGGPCGDGMHVCADVSDHCDVPSHTCVSQAGVGGYCTQPSDCSALLGLDCWDASHQRVSGGEAGTCQAPEPPGSTCDQFYQCASWACDDGGTCGPLLPSGAECVGNYQCASGTCSSSTCE